MINIKTLNSRFRRENLRGDFLSSSKKLQIRAEQLGFTTKSGYIKKSSLADKKMKKALEEYEREYYEEKTTPNYNMREDFKSLIDQFITPSEYWQIMRNASNATDFVNIIISYINIYDTFDSEYQEAFEEWLYGEFYQ